MAMPAVVVSGSELRITSVNSGMQKLIPASINYLADFFETRQPEFGVVSTLLTQGGSRQMSAIDVVAMPQRSGDDLKDDRSFHKVPVPLLKLAINGDLLMANEAARRLLGIKSVENINLRDLMNGLGRSLNDWLNRSAFGGGQPNSEFLRLKRAETETFLQVTLSRIMEAGGPTLFAVLTDATALKMLEAQFAQSQKMQAIGQLAGGVAPAPDLGLSAPAVDHVARAAAALEVRNKQAELLGFLLHLVGVDSEQVTGAPSWLRHRSLLPVLLAKRSGEVDGDMILRLPRVVRGVNPV